MYALDDREALESLETRIRILLPETYQDTYEDVQPVSMGSAALKFGPDGQVAWDDMWDTFCDLAMAGGPPHKGRLLEPASPAEVDAAPDRYTQVVREIARGISLTSGRLAQRSPVPGWVRMACGHWATAHWLLRAIVMENVSARVHGATIDLPAGPAFRLEKEIKNVVTVVAKTTHYWSGHTSREHQQVIRQLFVEMADQAPLIEPAMTHGAEEADRLIERIHAETGLPAAGLRYTGWVGVGCPDVPATIWMMRALVASNVLARREEATLFVPVNPTQDPQGAQVAGAVADAVRLARLKGVA